MRPRRSRPVSSIPSVPRARAQGGHRIAFAVALTGAVLAIGACGSSSKGTSGSSGATTSAASGTGNSASAGAAAPKIEKAWARSTPASAAVGAAYLTITSPTGDELTGVSVPSSVAKTAMLHQTTTQNGQMSMEPTAKVELPAGKAVTFSPGAGHIMLMNLTKPLVSGTTFELDLTLTKAGTQKVTVEVRDTAP